EIDVSYRRLGLHLGVRRSPLHDGAGVLALAELAAATAGLRFHGIMGYEAQIAGLPERMPFTALKRISAPAVASLRADCVNRLRARGLAPSVINGAGTGNAEAIAADPTINEITVGSGFLCGHLFDAFAEPALYFALQVVRRPARGLVTCHGGGYVASGSGGRDRLPRVADPEGAEL